MGELRSKWYSGQFCQTSVLSDHNSCTHHLAVHLLHVRQSAKCFVIDTGAERLPDYRKYPLLPQQISISQNWQECGVPVGVQGSWLLWTVQGPGPPWSQSVTPLCGAFCRDVLSCPVVLFSDSGQPLSCRLALASSKVCSSVFFSCNSLPFSKYSVPHPYQCLPCWVARENTGQQIHFNFILINTNAFFLVWVCPRSNVDQHPPKWGPEQVSPAFLRPFHQEKWQGSWFFLRSRESWD